MSLAAVNGNLSVPNPDAVAGSRPADAKIGAAGATIPRNEAVDVVRAFAAAGIVFVHAAESPTFNRWGNLFRFGVPFFLFASLYFQSLSLRRNRHRTLGHYVVDRFGRLYLPFVVWSVIYLIARDLERVFIHDVPVVWPRLTMLWTGTEYHLWFLPFLLGWSIALAVIHKVLLRSNPRWRWPLIAVAMVVGAVLASRPLPRMPAASELAFDDPIYTYIQWWLAFPAAFWAIAFAWFMTAGARLYGVSPIAGWCGLLLLFACSIEQGFYGLALAPRALTGLGSILPALASWKGSAVPLLARLGRYGYGIYLCHVIPVEIIHLICHKLHPQPAAWMDVANFAISFAAAWFFVHFLNKSSRLAFLAG